MEIPEGKLVLLWDHPKDCNKIEAHYNNQEFLMVKRHLDLNVYKIKPVNGEGPVWVINQHIFQDLGYTHEEEDSSGNDSNMGGPEVPSLTHKARLSNTLLKGHHYATHSKG